MDGFKVSELERMKLGGNKPWQNFFNNHKENTMTGLMFEDASIKERYDSEVGEEYKERLTAKVEGREYVEGTKSSGMVGRAKEAGMERGSRSATPVSGMGSTQALSSRSGTPLGGTRKTQNEAYFAKMGEANKTRPDDLPPSQGGKFAGFGSEPLPMRGGGGGGGGGAGGADLLGDLQKDPVAALTKGFGWLGKSALTGYEGWVKPNVQKVYWTYPFLYTILLTRFYCS